MKVLYGARKVRWDLLKCVNMLAKRVTKWTTGCDKALHGLMSYIFHNKQKVLRGYIGDTADKLRLKLYTDADLAGDRPSYRSTSGAILVLCGSNSFFPLAAMSKRQSSVSHSTLESEVVAASIGIRVIGVPQLDQWDTITKRSMQVDHAEDNQTAIMVMKVGVSPTMRHISCTHGISLSWLSEVVGQKFFYFYHKSTEWMAADVFTKAITKTPAWNHAVRLIGIVDSDSTTTRSLEREENLSKDTLFNLVAIVSSSLTTCTCIVSSSTAYRSICQQSTVSDSLSPSSSSLSFASPTSSQSGSVCHDCDTQVFCDTKRSLLAMPNFNTVLVKNFLTL